MGQQKDLRVNIRATPAQKALIERAAEAKRTTLSAFMLDRACEAAEQILAEQRHFELAPRQWAAFCAAMDAPPKSIPALKALLQKQSVFAAKPGQVEYPLSTAGTRRVQESKRTVSKKRTK